MKRRTFISQSSFITGTMMVPALLKGLGQSTTVPPGNKVLVVLQLSGGNDGLNTVIPVGNDIYYKSRPTLGIRRQEALPIGADAGLHPALTAFRDLYDQGMLAILNSVGYPEPDRSHFRSMDIWQSASGAREYLNTGWLGRYLDEQCLTCDKPTQAVELDDVLSLALKGETRKGLAFRSPEQLFGSSQNRYLRELASGKHKLEHERPVSYLYKTLADAQASAGYIYEKSRAVPSRHSYPDTMLGRQFRQIAGLILSDINTRVYYISLGSFDTHFMQQQTQKRLFTDLNASVKSFMDDLKQQGRAGDVLLCTFSEFGRRVRQNASGGTDHGAANQMFFIGGGLKQKGLINAMPDLSRLQDGDLPYKTDFRDVYATLLSKWLAVDDRSILNGRFNQLDFI